jgi:adenylate cyclase
VREFTLKHNPLPAGRHQEPAPELRTILFTDLEGHTAMMSRLGDAEGRKVLREHEQLTREALRAHGGQEVKTLGDGFMASFGSAQRALECAVALQRALSASDCAVSREGLGVRVGLNAGEPIAEDGDLFGASVIAAARIAARASGGQVYVADVVRQLAAGKGFLFSDTGEHDLKGLEDPVRLWELSWRPQP